ncbi:MAG TPA: glycosyltransferase family A protein [Puia sp.]|jgi:glycosyltransferase involved in cell wall biosynthesis
MEKAVFISICIPAYKRISFLKRLLDSIEIQTYRDFEVVVTDDSTENEVADLCLSHSLSPVIRYFKNKTSLGTPENWNESIRRASGEWIKLMHDDDWFLTSHALKEFETAVRLNPGRNFFFCEYTNVFLDKGRNMSSEVVRLSSQWQKKLEQDTKTLLSSNRIGPPSVTLHKNIPGVFYDSDLKWLVDIDFYIRFLQNSSPLLIAKNLIAVGLGEDQVTKQVFRNPGVEIPENLYLLNKIGVPSMRNIIVYDAYWRFLRNLDIRTIDQIRESGYRGMIPAVIESMIRFQSSIPRAVLKTGYMSKFLMTVHYAIHYPKLRCD